MIITGITGAIGHGKTSLANDLALVAGKAQTFESSGIILEVANTLRGLPVEHPVPTDLEAINEWLAFLPPILADITHVKVPARAFVITKAQLAKDTALYEKLFEYLAFMERWPTFARAELTAENKHRYRSLLQWLGGYCVLKVKDTIWFDELLRRVQNNPELDLSTIGGVRFPSDAACIRAAGGKIINVVRPLIAATDITDLTERERDAIVPDITVHNDGSLEQLSALARQLYKDLKAGKTHKSYHSSTFTV
jgi:hypothetical protein